MTSHDPTSHDPTSYGATAHDSLAQSSLPSPCSHWLRVRDGQTADPVRPLLADRVLIGSGSSCHIQIASHEVAMVHATLTRTAATPLAGWSIHSLAQHPAVLVNGEAVREATLQAGDLIGLAGVNLEFCVAGCERTDEADEAEPLDLDAFADNVLDIDETEPFRPAALSAGELVDAIERDLNLIAELTDDGLSDGFDDGFDDEADAGLLDSALVEVPEVDLPPVPRDPSRPRGLASIIRAAEQTRADAESPVSIPLHRGVIVPAAEDRDVKAA